MTRLDPKAVRITFIGVESLGTLEPLWIELHHHHKAVAQMPIEPDDALSWARRVRQYRTLLEAGEGFILVAHDGAVPRGYATVEIRDPDDTYGFGGRYAEVVTLGVSEAVRGRGIGSRLLDHVDAELSRRGVHAQIISVMVGNDGARRLYERRGFRAGEVSLYRPGRMP